MLKASKFIQGLGEIHLSVQAYLPVCNTFDRNNTQALYEMENLTALEKAMLIAPVNNSSW